MNCKSAQKRIGAFIRGTLSGNELRKTYYHINKCDKCKEILLDEFSFYTVFNDLDKELDFNYHNKINELLEKTGEDIKKSDSIKIMKYRIYSFLICVLGAVIVFIALKVVYR